MLACKHFALALLTSMALLPEDPVPCDPVPCDSSARCRASMDIQGDEVLGANSYFAEVFAIEKLRDAIRSSADNPGCDSCEFQDTCTDEIFVRSSAAVGEPTEEMGIWKCTKTLPKDAAFTVSCSACVDNPHIDPPD